MTKGWKTSEFWLTALFNLSALLTVVAGLVPSGAAPLVVAAAGIVTALYNFGRSLVKADAAKAAVVKAAVVQAAVKANTPEASETLPSGSVTTETISPAKASNALGTANALGAANAPSVASVPQRRATDKIGREVAAVLERAAVTAALQSGLASGTMGSVLGTALAGSVASGGGASENALTGHLLRKEDAPVATAQDGTAQNTMAQVTIADDEAGSEVFDERNAG